MERYGVDLVLAGIREQVLSGHFKSCWHNRNNRSSNQPNRWWSINWSQDFSIQGTARGTGGIWGESGEIGYSSRE